MKKTRIHFKNGETLILNCKLELFVEPFKNLAERKLGTEASFFWVTDETNKPYAMFNVYDVVYFEEVTK